MTAVVVIGELLTFLYPLHSLISRLPSILSSAPNKGTYKRLHCYDIPSLHIWGKIVFFLLIVETFFVISLSHQSSVNCGVCALYIFCLFWIGSISGIYQARKSCNFPLFFFAFFLSQNHNRILERINRIMGKRRRKKLSCGTLSISTYVPIVLLRHFHFPPEKIEKNHRLHIKSLNFLQNDA